MRRRSLTTIRLGASVVVMAVHSPLMIAHQWACLDYASNGRAILRRRAFGREHHYRQFEVPEEGRGSSFSRGIGSDPFAVVRAENDLSWPLL
jgi:alkanesulfonate monooxygenase SsuD/methylene tetrahydromethanopterin reductase-like flavin-dependent oxidoreductase (luciferase family)